MLPWLALPFPFFLLNVLFKVAEYLGCLDSGIYDFVRRPQNAVADRFQEDWEQFGAYVYATGEPVEEELFYDCNNGKPTSPPESVGEKDEQRKEKRRLEEASPRAEVDEEEAFFIRKPKPLQPADFAAGPDAACHRMMAYMEFITDLSGTARDAWAAQDLPDDSRQQALAGLRAKLQANIAGIQHVQAAIECWQDGVEGEICLAQALDWFYRTKRALGLPEPTQTVPGYPASTLQPADFAASTPREQEFEELQGFAGLYEKPRETICPQLDCPSHRLEDLNEEDLLIDIIEDAIESHPVDLSDVEEDDWGGC